eukprot:TRINITY_DN29295_c0_g1_i1.p2 TRINITY_DN29295_c0_g1~~TRINITY_DN29295_c0_g1_i1.p2  ORF type:complete len:272 (+),score=41.71 TRINITY_DN29295_c0_g1_i1:70-816(+)
MRERMSPQPPDRPAAPLGAAPRTGIAAVGPDGDVWVWRSTGLVARSAADGRTLIGPDGLAVLDWDGRPVMLSPDGRPESGDYGPFLVHDAATARGERPIIGPRLAPAPRAAAASSAVPAAEGSAPGAEAPLDRGTTLLGDLAAAAGALLALAAEDRRRTEAAAVAAKRQPAAAGARRASAPGRRAALAASSAGGDSVPPPPLPQIPLPPSPPPSPAAWPAQLAGEQRRVSPARGLPPCRPSQQLPRRS